MKLTINGTTLNILECSEEFDYGYRGLAITIDRNEIDLTTLENVVSTNTGNIVLEDGKNQVIYSGFTQSSSIGVNSDGKYYIKLGSVPETEKKVAELMTEIDNQTAVIEQQKEEMAMLTDCLLEMSEAVYA